MAQTTGELIQASNLDPDKLTGTQMLGVLLDGVRVLYGDKSPAEEALEKFMKIYCGEDGARKVYDLRNPAANEDEISKGIELDMAAKQGGKVIEPSIAAMSLGTIYATGRCTKGDFVRLSTAPVRDRRIFVESRKPLPVNTFRDAADDRTAAAAAAEGIARRIHGGR